MPIIYFGQKQDFVTNVVVNKQVDEFSKSISDKGYLTKEMYENLMTSLNHTNLLYEISFEHTYRVCEPEYRLRTLEEIIEEQNSQYTGDNFYTYREVVSTMPYVVDPIDNSGLHMNAETNESIIMKAVQTGAVAGHIHNTDCFCENDASKHVHDSNCYTTDREPCQNNAAFVPQGMGENHDGLTCRSCKRNRGYWSGYFYCSKCGRYVGYILSVNACTACGDEGYIQHNTLSLPCLGTVPSSSERLICTKNISKWYTNHGNGVEVFPSCDKMVVSLEPTHRTQKVYLGEPLITTAVISFKDGSTKTVLCSCDGNTDTIQNNNMVQLRYAYNIGETTYHINSNITITVVPKNKTCNYGHSYNLSMDGLDFGCIFCQSYVKSLRVIFPDTDQLQITVGSTLQENNVTLLATYYDGHTETISSEYVDNLDCTYVGAYKTVTIGYKGVYTTIQVKSVRRQLQCLICKKYYELYPNGTNPGCPHCIAKTPIFTGNVMNYEEQKYLYEILKTIYSGKVYYFSIGDQFLITLYNKSSSLGNDIVNKIYRRNRNIQILIKKDVMIHSQQLYTGEN